MLHIYIVWYIYFSDVDVVCLCFKTNLRNEYRQKRSEELDPAKSGTHFPQLNDDLLDQMLNPLSQSWCLWSGLIILLDNNKNREKTMKTIAVYYTRNLQYCTSIVVVPLTSRIYHRDMHHLLGVRTSLDYRYSPTTEPLYHGHANSINLNRGD